MQNVTPARTYAEEIQTKLKLYENHLCYLVNWFLCWNSRTIRFIRKIMSKPKTWQLSWENILSTGWLQCKWHLL